MKTIFAFAAAAAGVALRGVLLLDGGARGASTVGAARPRAAWRTAERLGADRVTRERISIQRDSVRVVPV